MDSKKIKLALLRMKKNESKGSLNSGRTIKLPKYTNLKGMTYLGNNNNINNTNTSRISNSIFKICSRKKYNSSMSSDKMLNFSSDCFPNDNNIDLLKDNLLKTKERYNEQNSELYKLKLKYNKLYQFHEDNLKILQSIINKAGINTNINCLNNEDILNITNTVDFSHIITTEEKENLKEKHLISCFKTKILEYQYLLDKKNEEILKLKNSSRILKLTKLESDNACKSLENINLSKEKKKLNEKILNMENVMGSLNNRCQKLEKNENKNMNNIGELQNKINNLINEIELKDKIIGKLNKKINKNKEENRIMEKKINNLENEINKYEEEKKSYKKYLDEKEKYETNDENMKKKLEQLKNENEKLTLSINKIKKEKNDFFIKYETIQKEKEKFLSDKEEIKTRNKDKEKQIKLINEKIKDKENKNEIIEKKIEELKKENENNYENETLNNLYIEKEKNHLEKIDLLKQKIMKLEEKNNIITKLIF